MADPEAVRTITVRREDQDITVEVVEEGWGLYSLGQAIDENGRPVPLTLDEWEEVLRLVRDGHDETGR